MTQIISVIAIRSFMVTVEETSGNRSQVLVAPPSPPLCVTDSMKECVTDLEHARLHQSHQTTGHGLLIGTNLGF